ncbi:MAG: hypothetical protein Q4C36_01970 [Coriobacteriia bacterium]|nr:hypothetical protein [Coriobacteriia bacterium]
MPPKAVTAQEEIPPLRDLGKDYVELWYESTSGYSGNPPKRVHLGEQARYYPEECVVQVEGWGPNGSRGKEYEIPPEITEKDDIIAYLDAQGVHVPFEYRLKRNNA